MADTEISYILGDDMLYNHYISHALYYLNRVGDDASCAYLTNNYIGRLYANGCYKAAWNMLEIIGEDYNINSLSANMQARYYLCCADVAQMGEIPKDEYLAKAAAAIDKSGFAHRPGQPKKVRKNAKLLRKKSYSALPYIAGYR